MADTGTLCTSAQALLAIGADANAAQVLEANTNIWTAYAESDMETEAGDNVGLVANYASITAANKQWLAGVCATRTAWYAIMQDPNQWNLSTTQTKLNFCDTMWSAFIKKIKDKDTIADLGL